MSPIKKTFWVSVVGMTLLFTACQTDTGNVGDLPNDPAPLAKDTAAEDAAAKPPPKNKGFAEDYVNTNRVIWQKPEMIINLMGELKNKTVADIGAGRGFFALRLAPKAEKVIAIDILPRFIDYLDSVKVMELPENIQPKLETRLAEPNDPNLNPSEADLVLIVNTYMYIKDRTSYLQTLKEGIREGGKLLIVDFKKKRTPIGPPSDIRIPLFQVEEELYEAGYRDISTNDTALDYQYILTAQK